MCDTCEFSYLKAIAEFYENDERSIRFFRDHGVLMQGPVICKLCGSECTYRADKHQWLSRHWDHRTLQEGTGLSRVTTVDWRSFCAEVTPGSS